MTICPCCGSKTNGDWSNDCACGARSVGEPLPRPDHELPSYSRALILTVSGSLMVVVLIAQTINAFLQKLPTSKTYTEAFAVVRESVFGFWTWVAAAETAAWQLKWVALFATLLVMFGCRKWYRSVKESPAQFCGLKFARLGYLTSAAVPVLIAILIGVTVPVRWERHQWGLEAHGNSQAYRINRALDDYRVKFGTLPGDLKDLRRLQDSDGSLTAALEDLDSSTYTPSAEIAAVPTKQPRTLRGAVISNASLENDTDETLNDRLSFTNYELLLPGQDKKIGTEDDQVLWNGIISPVAERPRRAGSATAAGAQVARP